MKVRAGTAASLVTVHLGFPQNINAVFALAIQVDGSVRRQSTFLEQSKVIRSPCGHKTEEKSLRVEQLHTARRH